MPANIPTIDRTKSVQVGDYSVRGNPAAAAQVGNAVTDLGNTLQNTAHQGFKSLNLRLDRQAELQTLNDTTYANTLYGREKLELDKFVIDNAQDTEVYQKTEAFIKARREALDTSNLSPEVARQFTKNWDTWTNAKLSDVYALAIKNQLTLSVNSVKEQTQTAITSFRLLANTSEKDATKSLLDSIAQITAGIRDGIGKQSFDTAKGLHEDLITQAVLATANVNPGLAKAILDRSSEIDEQTRHNLLNTIATANKSINIGARITFDNARKDILALSKAGQGKQIIPEEAYLAHYPEAQALQLKAKDDALLDVYANGNLILQHVAPQEAEYQQHVLDTLGDKTKWTGQYNEDLFDFVNQRLTQIRDLQKRNSVKFLTDYNPVVKQAFELTKSATEDTAPELFSRYYDALLFFQGPATKETDKKEVPWFLNRSMNDWHLLDVEKAKETASQLNISKPQEVIQKINEFLAQYPKESHQQIALQDLVNLGGLSEQYQLAFQNKDEWWIDSYLNAIKGGEDIKVDTDTKKEIYEALIVNDHWVNFDSHMTGDKRQGEKEATRGFRAGILKYAEYLSKNHSASDAVEIAARQLIGSTLGFTKVNDQTMMIVRDRGPGKVPFNDDEITDIGRRLTFVPQFLPAADIDLTPFVKLNLLLTDPAKQQEAIINHLSAKGFWQNTNDGKGASLYAVDEEGIQPFQVTDKEGKPFVVHFEELPAFEPAKTAFGKVPLIGRSVPGVASGFNSIYSAKHPGLTPNNKNKRPSWLKDK